jgi:hypothetical protein
MIGRKSNKYGTTDLSGKTAVEYIYDKITPINDELGTARLNNKGILFNLSSGKRLSPINFDQVDSYCYCDQKIVIAMIGGKDVLVNTITGKLVGKDKYDNARFLYNLRNRAEVKLNGKYGVINTVSGAWVLPVKYIRIEDIYKDGKYVIAVIEKENVQYVDENGKQIKETTKQSSDNLDETEFTTVEVEPAQQDNADKDLFVYNEGNGDWKLTIEERGYRSTKILETSAVKGYSQVEKLSYKPGKPAATLLKAVKDGHTGIIDITGNTLLPFEYDDIIYDRYSGYLQIKQHGKTGILRENLSVLKQPVLKRIIGENISNNLVLVEMPDGKKGYMRMKDGKIYIPGIKE